MTTHSVKKRYSFKLLGKLVSVFSTLIVMTFVPRSLGPEDFGRFQFITSHFQLVFSTLTFSAPAAYFNWVSRKDHRENIDLSTGVSFIFVFLVSLLIVIAVALSLSIHVEKYLWPDIPVDVIWNGVLFAFLVIVTLMLSYLSDGRALTVGQEKQFIFQTIVKTILLVLFFFVGWLNLTSYFGIINFVQLLFIVMLLWRLFREKAITRNIFFKISYSYERVAQYVKFVYSYSKPLVYYTLFSFAYGYFDRWFLQWIGGATQQGFYGFSYNLGALAFLFSGAMTPVITREFANAHESGDMERLRSLFDRIKLFFVLAAVIGIFISVQSVEIINLFGGEKYRGAKLAVALMALYPLHQTFGQLSAALMLSTGKTGLISRIGIFGMILGIVMTPLLIAPGDFIIPGLGLGSAGLALKTLLIQFVLTNIQLFYNTKYLQISFAGWLFFQVRSMAVLFVIAFISHQAGAYLGHGNLTDQAFGSVGIREITSFIRSIATVFISGITYFILLGIVLWKFPLYLGVSKTDIREFLKLVSQKISFSKR